MKFNMYDFIVTFLALFFGLSITVVALIDYMLTAMMYSLQYQIKDAREDSGNNATSDMTNIVEHLNTSRGKILSYFCSISYRTAKQSFILLFLVSAFYVPVLLSVDIISFLNINSDFYAKFIIWYRVMYNILCCITILYFVFHCPLLKYIRWHYKCIMKYDDYTAKLNNLYKKILGRRTQ